MMPQALVSDLVHVRGSVYAMPNPAPARAMHMHAALAPPRFAPTKKHGTFS